MRILLSEVAGGLKRKEAAEMEVSIIDGANLVGLQSVGIIVMVFGVLVTLFFGAFLVSPTEDDLKKIRSDIFNGQVLASLCAVIAFVGVGLVAFAFQQYGYGKSLETLRDGNYELEVAFGEVPDRIGIGLAYDSMGPGVAYHLIVWGRTSDIEKVARAQRSVKLPPDAHVTLDGTRLTSPSVLAGKYVRGTLKVTTEKYDRTENKGGHDWKTSKATKGKIKTYNILTRAHPGPG